MCEFSNGDITHCRRFHCSFVSFSLRVLNGAALCVYIHRDKNPILGLLRTADGNAVGQGIIVHDWNRWHSNVARKQVHYPLFARFFFAGVVRVFETKSMAPHNNQPLHESAFCS